MLLALAGKPRPAWGALPMIAGSSACLRVSRLYFLPSIAAFASAALIGASHVFTTYRCRTGGMLAG
jgi:hypothetical protein